MKNSKIIFCHNSKQTIDVRGCFALTAILQKDCELDKILVRKNHIFITFNPWFTLLNKLNNFSLELECFLCVSLS